MAQPTVGITKKWLEHRASTQDEASRGSSVFWWTIWIIRKMVPQGLGYWSSGSICPQQPLVAVESGSWKGWIPSCRKHPPCGKSPAKKRGSVYLGDRSGSLLEIQENWCGKECRSKCIAAGRKKRGRIWSSGYWILSPTTKKIFRNRICPMNLLIDWDWS